MFTLLDAYIARTLVNTTGLTLAVLVGLSSLLGFIEQLSKVGQGSYDIQLAAVYVFLSMPRDIEQMFPMATLIGGLMGMGALASNSELIVMQASGLSRADIIRSAMKSALLMVVFVMALGEWVAPISEAKAKEIRTQAISGGSLFSSERLVWAKDGDKFVSIGEVMSTTELRDVTIYEFDDALNMRRITGAKSANFSGERWQLSDVNSTDLNSTGIESWHDEQLVFSSSLTPDKLGVVTVKPEALSIQGLTDYVNYLNNNSQDASRYQLALWRKVLQPLSVAAMLLMALSFIFGPLRSMSMGARIIFGVITGFGFFIADQMFGSAALVYQLPPIAGALLPSLVFAGAAGFLLQR